MARECVSPSPDWLQPQGSGRPASDAGWGAIQTVRIDGAWFPIVTDGDPIATPPERLKD
jgi:hypothetical protein